MPEETGEDAVGEESAGGVAARMTSDMEEAMSPPSGKTDSPSKRQGKVKGQRHSTRSFAGFQLSVVRLSLSVSVYNVIYNPTF